MLVPQCVDLRNEPILFRAPQTCMQHTATRCNTLQLEYTATHCNTLCSVVSASDVKRDAFDIVPRVMQGAFTGMYGSFGRNVGLFWKKVGLYQHLMMNKQPLALFTGPTDGCNTHCTTLHHAAPRCATLHHAAPRCPTLHNTVPHCTTLHHTAPHWTTATSRAHELRLWSSAVQEVFFRWLFAGISGSVGRNIALFRQNVGRLF